MISNIIIITIILIILVLTIFFSRKNPNDKRHLYNNNEYAHFSKLNTSNYWFYPKYYFSHPQKFELKEGDALYIPKNWWHWVFSYENTFGVNYWWNENDTNKIFFENPKKFTNYIKPINLLDKNIDKKINTKILGSNKTDQKFITSNLDKYIKSNEDDTYLITLNAFVNNTEFKNYIKNILEHPDFIKKNQLDKNYNLWYCVKEKDTGLHQDDNYGLLCVLSGKKTVYLYPPSDRKYLNPYPLEPSWTNYNYEDLEFNIFKSNGYKKNKIPSSKILYETMRKNPKNTDIKQIVTDIVSKMTNIFGYNKIIWGAKCDKKGNIWWEYYFYDIDKYRKSEYLLGNYNKNFNKIKEISYLRNFKTYDLESLNLNNISIFSFEIHNTEYVPTIDLYINMNKDKSIKLPFYGKTYNYNGVDLTYKNSFILCTMKHFLENIDEILDYFEFRYLKKEILNEVLKYKYVKLMTFYKKNDSYICIQWFGLTMQDFIIFLKENNWLESLIKYYTENQYQLEHIRREITINYTINGNQLEVDRTSIYGSV